MNYTKTTAKAIEVAKQYGREDMAKAWTKLKVL